MTPKQIMEAYKAIHELAACVLPFKTARSVHKLKVRLVEEFDTVLNAEKSMAEKYGGTVKDGRYFFESEEDAAHFHAEYAEFLKQEDSIDLPYVDVSRCLDAVRISPAAIEVLETIVCFGED